MTRLTRSNTQKNSKSTRKKRLSKNRFHRVFGRINVLEIIKKIFRGRILLTTACVCMLGFILFAVFSPYFSLKNFTITSESQSPTKSEIENSLQDFVGNNLFLLKKSDLKNKILHKFLEIKEISINTKWPNTVQINFTTAPAAYTVNNEATANNVTISNDGIVLLLKATEGLPVLKLQQHEKIIKIRDRILTEENLKKIAVAEKLLFEKLEILFDSRIYLNHAQEVHFVTKRKQAVIWIDLTQDIEEQIQKLVLAEKRIQFQSKRFDHIDLRIPRQIFWEWL